MDFYTNKTVRGANSPPRGTAWLRNFGNRAPTREAAATCSLVIALLRSRAESRTLARSGHHGSPCQVTLRSLAVILGVVHARQVLRATKENPLVVPTVAAYVRNHIKARLEWNHLCMWCNPVSTTLMCGLKLGSKSHMLVTSVCCCALLPVHSPLTRPPSHALPHARRYTSNHLVTLETGWCSSQSVSDSPTVRCAEIHFASHQRCGPRTASCTAASPTAWSAASRSSSSPRRTQT